MTLSLGQHCPEAKLIKVFKEEEDVEKPPFLRQWGGGGTDMMGMNTLDLKFEHSLTRQSELAIVHQLYC